MSIIRTLLLGEMRDGSNLARWQGWLDGWWGPSTTGMMVTHDTALAVSAVYASVRIIAETIGSLPLTLYRRKPDGSKEEAIDEPLYQVLKMPNGESTQMHFFQTLSGHSALRGNSYAQLIRDGKGRVVEMWPLHPDRVVVERRNGILVYRVMPDTFGSTPEYQIVSTNMQTQTLFQDDIMHHKVFSQNGVTGMSPLQFARNNFGVAMAQEEYSARLFSNGAMPRGVLSTDAEINEQEFSAIKAEWKKVHEGVWNAGKTAILPAGLRWQQLSLSAEDAQVLSSRQFQIAEIARIFRVPMHLLQDLSKATNNNIEQQSLEFVIHTIRPWIVSWEQTISMQVLTPGQIKKGLFVEFNHEALLRGDMKSESSADNTYIMNGVYSVNEVRLKKGLNPVEGGDEHYIGLNMGALSDVNSPSTEPDAADIGNDIGPTDQSDDAEKLKKQVKKLKKQSQNSAKNDAEIRAKDAFKAFIWSDICGLQRKEAAALSKQARKLRAKEFDAWLDKFLPELRDDMRQRLCETMPIVARGISEKWDAEKVVERINDVSDTYVAGVKSTLQALIERSAEGDAATSWARFCLLLDSPELAEERKALAEQIAINEIEALVAMGGEHAAA